MKKMNFIFFFSIVFIIYAGVNYYIIRRGLQALPNDSNFRIWLVILVVFFALAFIGGRVLENQSITWFSTALIWIGSFWLAFMVHFFMILLIIDLIRLLNHFIGFYPTSIKENYEQVKMIAFYSVVALSTLIVTAGYINSIKPQIRNLTIKVDKQVEGLDSLKIAMVSDIHFGTIIGRGRGMTIVEKINSLNPDIILIPGDIVDEDVKPVIENNAGDALLRLKAKYGVYGTTGNHEYIGGVESASKYINDHGVNLLRDTTILVDDKFYVVGREDRAISSFTNGSREPLGELLSGVDKSKPVILMDHQPFKLEEAMKHGIDLQLSGHTHHGQIYPFNYITDMVYELSWGYKQKEETHYYVSCGVGGWGPPIRTGSRPEVMNIKIIFGNVSG